MQNIGFAFSVLPALKKFYKKENLNQAVLRHMGYFNTHPYMAGFTLGLCARMEEDASQQNDTDKNDSYAKIDTLKSAVSTASAAIGDRLFWGILKPFCLVLTIFTLVALNFDFFGFSLRDRLIAVIALSIGFLFYNSVSLFVRWNSIEYGYRCAQDKYCGLDFLNWNKFAKILRLTGLALVLLTVATFLIRYDVVYLVKLVIWLT